MNEEELVLLENILDSLDRLFDEESQIIDIHALIFATSKALAKTSHFQILDKTAEELNEIIKADKTKNNLRELALTATDELRHYIAKFFPIIEEK